MGLNPGSDSFTVSSELCQSEGLSDQLVPVTSVTLGLVSDSFRILTVVPQLQGWMILESLSGFSNSSTVITENWQAKGVSATDEVHLVDSKSSNMNEIQNFECVNCYKSS